MSGGVSMSGGVADMAIRPNHQHVGSDGMCYMPLLHNWQSSPYAHNNNLTNVAMVPPTATSALKLMNTHCRRSYSGFLQQRLLCSQSHNCRPSSRPSSSSSTGLRRHLSIGRHHHQSLSRHLKLPGCRMFRRHQSHDLRPPSSLLNGSDHLQTTTGHPQPQVECAARLALHALCLI